MCVLRIAQFGMKMAAMCYSDRDMQNFDLCGATARRGEMMMAEEADLRFLGEQIKRLQGDVRQLKADVSNIKADVGQFRSEQLRLENEFAQLGRRFDVFIERVDDRFDQVVELIKSSFRTLAGELESLRSDVRKS